MLVIGGTRLIGPPVVRRLVERGHDVAVFSRGQTEVELPAGVARIVGDRESLGDFRQTFQQFAPEVVVHQICFTEAQAKQAMEVFSGLAKRLVVLSSCDVYRAFGRVLQVEDGPVEPTPLTEDAPLRTRLYPYRGMSGPGLPDDNYDKILVERTVLSEADLPATVLRLPMVYGPRDHRHRLYGYARRMADGRPAIVIGETASKWRTCRAFVHDVAHAIALAAEHGGRTIYNVADGRALTEKAWIETVGAVFGWSGKVVVVPDETVPEHLRFHGDAGQDLTLDTARIRAALGYAEPTDFKEGLRRTLAWTLSHPPVGNEPTSAEYAAEDAALSG
ncbi:MAG: NAD-dependent epimerase/dehydratase family protein [Myxococcales bacterium]|nr:NAD-dependent epimerase/dehydratase family protein [Myxococcales bacterium]